MACGDDTTGPTVHSGLAVDPLAARALHAGDSVSFRAFRVLDDGTLQPVEGSWDVLDTSVAEIDASGVATARGVGATVVEFRAGGEEASASFVVHPDTTPPTLEGVFASQTRVSVSFGPVVVPVTATVRDEGSGVRRVVGLFDGPLGAGITGLITFSPQGDASESGAQVYSGSLDIPGFIGVGTWTLNAIRADDRMGNSRRWGDDALDAMGMKVEIVATTGDGG